MTTLLVSVQHGLMGPVDSPLGHVSYLADTVVLLRYYELKGEVRRAVSVFKRRTGAHERTIRDIIFAPTGISIGPALREFAAFSPACRKPCRKRLRDDGGPVLERCRERAGAARSAPAAHRRGRGCCRQGAGGRRRGHRLLRHRGGILLGGGRGGGSASFRRRGTRRCDVGRLSGFLEAKPAWSDIPLIILTVRRREAAAHWRLVADVPSVRNATLLERPMRIETLLQAVRVALRTRERQYELRAYIAERERLLAQRDMLLREVHHRVKNNLQMIQSLVRMSLARAPAEARPLITDLASRIGAIGHLHSRIYASENLTEIDAASYLADVVDEVSAAYGALEQRVRITKRLSPCL